MIVHLDGFRCIAADRGYFGTAVEPSVEAACAVGHSLGGLHLLQALPRGCRGVVIINGFDRFAAMDGRPGVPSRIIDRMLTRFAQHPLEVVTDFRARCGAPPPPETLNAARLGADLRLLRYADARTASAALALPVLLLQGGQDPILPAELRENSFAETGNVRRETLPDGGHLLPLSHPRWCAERIRAFAEGLA